MSWNDAIRRREILGMGLTGAFYAGLTPWVRPLAANAAAPSDSAEPPRLAGQAESGGTRPTTMSAPFHLRCEYLDNPQGIDVSLPRLSWWLVDPRRGAHQTAWQVLVASSPERLAEGKADLWDSGKVESGETLGLEYAGKPLRSRQYCHWVARVWDGAGQPTAWSQPALWTMGLLEPSDWQAQWIGDPTPPPAPLPPHYGYRSQPSDTADAPKWVALDLGTPTAFNRLRLHGTRKFGAPVGDVPGYLFPIRFRLEAATRPDFSDARMILDQTGEDVLNPGLQPLTWSLPPTTAQYVRLAVTAMRIDEKRAFGLALAELELLDGLINRSRGAAVTASDSVEDAEWSVHKLVDGDLNWHPGGDVAPMPPPLLRRVVQLPGAIRRATVFASALGVYELWINGHKVGDRILAPEWTDYNRIVQYQTEDVTALLQTGGNTIGVMLGDGWYAGRIGMSQFIGAKRLRGVYGRKPQFRMQLHVEFEDGSTQTVLTDGLWRSTTQGPIRTSDIYDGEVQDARLAQDGWHRTEYDDARWTPVEITQPAVTMVAQMAEPIRIQSEIKARTVTDLHNGLYIFDLAQTIAGRARLRVRGRTGDRVILRHAEALTPDGQLYAALNRGAAQQDEFILRGDPEGETLEPVFTYHGFRYIEVAGLRVHPAPSDLSGIVFNSSAPETGTFETSNPMVNRLWENIRWSQRGNLMSVFTDCPQRDERLGWLGDYGFFAHTAFFNANLASFLGKTVRDMQLAQMPDGRFPDLAPNVLGFLAGIGWADTGVLAPWVGYVHFADRRLLAGNFDAARRWVDWLQSRSKDLIYTGTAYADWLNGDQIALRDWPTKGATPSMPIFGTAFFANSAHTVARIAEVLDRKEDAAHYQALFEEIRTAFQKQFIAADGRMPSDNQSEYTLALNFDLMPEPLRPAAAGYLVEAIERYGGRVSTGIPLTHRMMLELTRAGHTDVAYRLLNQRKPPSWGYMIDQGATTIWERWDGFIAGREQSDYKPELRTEMQAPTLATYQAAHMNSLNHAALGSVGEWLYRVVLGLEPSETEPGFRHFTIHPQPGGGLTFARGAVETVRGRIAIDWAVDQGAFTLAVTVPPSTTATLILPVETLDGVTESGQPLAQAQGVSILDAETKRLRLQSGSYTIKSSTVVMS